VDIHEHINRYSVKSVTELLRSAGLSLAAIQTEEVDFGWISATVIRGLGKKR
jgi:3-oxoacyl-(acyl-carrier-protein) synthase